MRRSHATETALEVESLRSVLGDFAATDLGSSRLAGLQPLSEAAAWARQRSGFEAVGALLRPPVVPQVEEAFEPLLSQLGNPAFAPDGRDLLLFATLFEVGEQARRRVEEAFADSGTQDEDVPAGSFRFLVEEFARLPSGEALAEQIRRRLDSRGEVRDDATPELARLRRTVRSRRESLYRQLGEVRRDQAHLLSEDTVPQRDGRLVLVLQSGAKGQMPGLVHGRSATGKSYYFEPLEVVEGNNDLQEASEAIEREKRRILEELRQAVGAHQATLRAHAEVVGQLDQWQAIQHYAQRVEARLLDEAPRGRLALIGARHPLLDPRLADVRQRALGLAGHRDPVVPLDLALEPSCRTLVITGPNAGGKTVALKTLGLAAWAHACGLPVPAGPGSSMPALQSLVATIGDDQDLLADRSTFSGRLLRLHEVWEVAGRDSLILLDELGSGTDPEEGAALSAALLEELIDRESLVVVTTHLGQLAALAMERDGASCAAMEFDAERGAPRYRLVSGPPGGSEALALARRLGLAEELVVAAEARLGVEGRDYRRLLAEVSARRDRLAEQEEAMESARKSAEALREQLVEERERLELERRAVGKRAREELERFRIEVRGELGRAVERLREEWESGRRRGLDRQVTDELFASAPEIAAASAPEAAGPIAVGDRVSHRSLGWQGTLVSMQRGRAEVDLDGKRLRCRETELARVGAPPPARLPPARRAPLTDLPEMAPLPLELNLIGQRVEPALEALEGHLEEAVRQGRRELRVVHGHGTGRLRRAVRETLTGHALVDSQRPGGAGEGGDGATVVSLK